MTKSTWLAPSADAMIERDDRRVALPALRDTQVAAKVQQFAGLTQLCPMLGATLAGWFAKSPRDLALGNLDNG